MLGGRNRLYRLRVDSWNLELVTPRLLDLAYPTGPCHCPADSTLFPLSGRQRTAGTSHVRDLDSRAIQTYLDVSSGIQPNDTLVQKLTSSRLLQNGRDLGTPLRPPVCARQRSNRE